MGERKKEEEKKRHMFEILVLGSALIHLITSDDLNRSTHHASFKSYRCNFSNKTLRWGGVNKNEYNKIWYLCYAVFQQHI